MRTHLYALLLLKLLIYTACGGRSDEKAPLPANSRIPEPMIRYLLDSCTTIDYILYNPSMSMSITQKASISQHIDFISRDAASIKRGCMPAGRILYQAQDQIPLEADLYFNDSCRYLILYDRLKHRYVHRISPTGVEFFQKIRPTSNK